MFTFMKLFFLLYQYMYYNNIPWPPLLTWGQAVPLVLLEAGDGPRPRGQFPHQSAQVHHPLLLIHWKVTLSR